MSTISQYESHTSDGDQKNAPQQEQEKLTGGKEGSHKLNDYHDGRSLATRAEDEKKREKQEKREEEEAAKNPELPTAAAKANGNQPSKGAQIDEQIMLEEQAELAKKDAKK